MEPGQAAEHDVLLHSNFLAVYAPFLVKHTIAGPFSTTGENGGQAPIVTTKVTTPRVLPLYYTLSATVRRSLSARILNLIVHILR